MSSTDKWTAEERELTSEMAKRLRARGLRRGGFFIRKVCQKLGVTLDSPQKEKDKAYNYLLLNSSVSAKTIEDVARRIDTTFKAAKMKMFRKKVDLDDPEAVEAFIRREIESDGSWRQVTDDAGKIRQVNIKVDRKNLIWQPDALPHEPETHGKQYEFLESQEDFTLAEGGKGSGKSDLLIMDTIRPEKMNHPLWHGVIFRREYKRLMEIIDRAHYWFGRMPHLKAHWQGQFSRFMFPSGSWLAFHNVQNMGDEKQYQGWQICDLKFDQLEEISPEQFQFLALQNRAGSLDLKPTIRATANPGGLHHAFYNRTYIKPYAPSETHEITMEIDGQKYVKTFRRIHMTVFDNPLLKRDARYIATLASDPDPVRRKAMFLGDWDVVVGQFFTSYFSPVHLKTPVKLPENWKRLGGMDYGNHKALEVVCVDYMGNSYAEWECYTQPTVDNPSGHTASEYGEISGRFLLERNLDGLVVLGDTNMWSATGRDVGSNKIPAYIIQEIWKEMFEKENRKMPILIPVTKRGTEEYRYRLACNEAVKDALAYKMDERGTVTKDPKLFIFDRCQGLADAFGELQADPNDPRDLAEKQNGRNPYDAFKMPFFQIIAPKTPLGALTAQQEWDMQVGAVDKREKKEYVPTGDWRIDGVI